MMKLPAALATAFVLLVALCSLAGCGHCDGAVRVMFANAEGAPASREHRGEPAVDRTKPFAIPATAQFRLTGDGPLGTSDKLLAVSRIGPQTWVLLDESGRPVNSTITSDAGGHMCRNGVGFTLVPSAPLEPGDYRLVLRLTDIAWPAVEDVDSHDGKSAIVRLYRVAR
jgi:hypothetical protein